MLLDGPLYPSPEEFNAITQLPLFLGYIFSFMLQGILFIQVFIYRVSFPNDSKRMKALVYLVFFLECFSSFLATYAAIASLLTEGDLLDAAFIWAFMALGPLCGIVTFLVHAFYSWRIWIIGSSMKIPVSVITLSVIQCMMVSYSGLRNTLGAGLSTYSYPGQLAILILWLGCTALCDIIITSTLVYMFRRESPKCRVETQTVISKITLFVIEAGTVTCFGATTELVFFLMFRNSFIHFILFYILPKLYANCMMASLNARIFLPERRFQEERLQEEEIHNGNEVIFSIEPQVSELGATRSTDIMAMDLCLVDHWTKPLPKTPISAALPFIVPTSPFFV